MTNCKNCGAVIDLSVDKCPYCDTPYIDILGDRRLKIKKLKRSAELTKERMDIQALYADAINAMRVYSNAR